MGIARVKGKYYASPAVDVNDSELKLQNALDAREESKFGVVIDECKNFLQVFQFTAQCADLALKTGWPLEKNKLENMMEHGLKRMCMIMYMLRKDLDDMPDMLGSEVARLWSCLRVIERYWFSTSRNDLLEFVPRYTDIKLGHLLWSSCPAVVDSEEFPEINAFIYSRHFRFLECKAWNGILWHQKFGDFFRFANACQKRGLTPRFRGKGLEALFQYWRDNEKEREAVLKSLVDNDITDYGIFCDSSLFLDEFFLEVCTAGRTAHLVRILLSKGADINTMNGAGETALHFASSVDVICALLERGASFKETTSDGSTPLHSASKYGHVAVICKWLEMGIDVNHPRERDGITPLYLASQNGHFEVARVLLEKGAFVHACCWATQRDLLDVVQNGSDQAKERMQEFIKKKFVRGGGGNTAIELNALDMAYSMHGEESPICQLLIQKAWEQRAQRKQASITFMGLVRRGFFRSFFPRELAPDVGQMIFPRHVRRINRNV